MAQHVQPQFGDLHRFPNLDKIEHAANRMDYTSIYYKLS